MEQVREEGENELYIGYSMVEWKKACLSPMVKRQNRGMYAGILYYELRERQTEGVSGAGDNDREKSSHKAGGGA